MPEPIIIPVIYTEDTSGLEKALAETRKVQAATQDLQATQKKAVEDAIEGFNEQAVAIAVVSQTTAELNKVANLEATIARSKKGSYNALNAELQLLIMRQKQMTEQQIKGTKEGKALTAEITKLKEKISSLTKEQKPLNEILGTTLGNLGEMRRELIALRNTSFAGKTSAEIEAINKRIGELTDGISDLRAVQNEFGNEFGSQIAGSLQVVTAGVEGIVGALNVLGIESPALKELQKNVVDLIAVTQALGAIEDALAKGTLTATAARIKNTVALAYNTAAQKINEFQLQAAARAELAKVAATNADSTATKAAAAAQWLWNAALTAFPVAAIVAGVVAIGAGIVALTNYINENREATKALESNVNNLAGAYSILTEQQDFRFSLAQEIGKKESELTKIQQQGINERIAAITNERQARLKLLELGDQSADQQEENSKRIKELSELELSALNERILLRTRYGVQIADEAKKEAELAQQRKKEREQEAARIKAEREKRAKENQDFILRELEAQKQFDLSRLDAARDYVNTSKDYINQFNAVRLTTEQAAQVEILTKQKEFGRITETEYKAQLERIRATLKEFEDSLIDSNRVANLDPLESIFGDEQRQDILKRAEKIASTAVEVRKTFFDKLKEGQSFLEAFGLKKETAEQIKTQLQGIFSQTLSGFQFLADAELAQQEKIVANRQAVISELQRQLSEEKKLKDNGVASDYDALQRKLNGETELLKKEEEKRLALEKKAAQLRLRQEALQTASNIALSVTKVIAAESGKGILGIITAVSAVASIFALIAKSKAQAAQFSQVPKLRHGGNLSELFEGEVVGASHEGGGVPAWLREQNRPIELEGKEFVMPVEQTAQHNDFLEQMRGGAFDGKDVSKYYSFGEAAHERPTDFLSQLPQLPNYSNEHLPAIRKLVMENQKWVASQSSRTAIEVKALRGEMSDLRRAILEKPDYIPLTEMGYMKVHEVGNTKNINIYAPPKTKDSNK